MRRSLATFLALSMLALVIGALDVQRGSASSKATTVTIDLKAGRQVMQGFGTSERVWSDPHLSDAPVTTVPVQAQRSILSDLYRRLGLTRVRVVLDPGIQAARGGPFNFNGKLGEDQIAFIRQAKAFGLQTFFPGPVYLEDWMTPSDVGPYVSYAMTILRYWRSRGLEPPLYAPLNEPQIARNFPPEWMHDVVLQLGKAMRSEGFKTKLVIPDDENPIDAYRRAVAVLGDPAARKYVAAVAFHIYKGGPSDWPPLRQLAARYGLPLWMTEYGSKGFGSWPGALEWATTIHQLMTVGGVSAVDLLWGFFGDWIGGEPMISIRFDHGAYQGFSELPTYWLTGQWSRFVRPGYRRVATSADAGAVPTTAFTGPKRLVVVALNPADGPATVRFTARGGRVLGRVSGFRTSALDRWRTVAPVAVRSNGFSAVLPPQSVTTFVVARR